MIEEDEPFLSPLPPPSSSRPYYALAENDRYLFFCPPLFFFLSPPFPLDRGNNLRRRSIYPPSSLFFLTALETGGREQKKVLVLIPFVWGFLLRFLLFLFCSSGFFFFRVFFLPSLLISLCYGEGRMVEREAPPPFLPFPNRVWSSREGGETFPLFLCPCAITIRQRKAVILLPFSR